LNRDRHSEALIEWLMYEDDMNDAEPAEYFGFEWFGARWGEEAMNAEQSHEVLKRSKCVKKPYTCTCALAFNLAECPYHVGKSCCK